MQVGTNSVIKESTKINSMENIYIKVAYCTNCGGYHSSTPENLAQINHPEIIDHYFYHGEPWFTLDQSVFKMSEMLEETEIKRINLTEHREHDHEYCHCKKKIQTAVKTPFDQFSIYPNTLPVAKTPIETEEVYFRDVYQLSYNFH